MSSRKFFEQKQPSEKYLVGIDFALDLATGEVISSAVVTAFDSSGNLAPTIIEGAAQIGTVSGKLFTPDANGTWVVATIKAGTGGQTYKVSMVATTDTPHIFEGDIELAVVDT